MMNVKYSIPKPPLDNMVSLIYFTGIPVAVSYKVLRVAEVAVSDFGEAQRSRQLHVRRCGGNRF